MVYSARLSLGTPQQSFRVMLDTGSTLLWVLDKKCQVAGKSCAQVTGRSYVARDAAWTIGQTKG